ncbi:MAG: ABC transporter substrate-binding protein [Clostridia bacterium]
MIAPTDMTLRPLEVMDHDPRSLFSLVYEGLVVLDDDRRPQPGLAESWHEVGDGTTWIFQLRENVFFHDGRSLTAYDVIATLNAIKKLSETDGGVGPYRLVTNMLTAWSADDNRTVRIKTSRPFYGLLYDMTFPILPAASV